jgi:hypothetical protein
MSILRRTTIVAVVLGGLLFGGAAPMHAHRYAWCEHRIHEAEQDLRRAIHRHGEDSREAEMRRHRLEEIRERCRDRHERREERHEEHEMHEQGY